MLDDIKPEAAKEAYVLMNQLDSLEKVLVPENVSGYRAAAENYNRILQRAKTLLSADNTFLRSIEHLKEQSPSLAGGYITNYNEIKISVPVLKAALYAFCNFYLPKREKDRIGF